MSENKLYLLFFESLLPERQVDYVSYQTAQENQSETLSSLWQGQGTVKDCVGHSGHMVFLSQLIRKLNYVLSIAFSK